MGVKYGAAVLYSLKGLTIGDVVDICNGLAKDSGRTALIDVDCSNVCFKVGKSVPALASFLMKWAATGLCVVPVCDGDERPVCKQATNERKAKREKNRIKASIARADLRRLRSKLYSDPTSRIKTLEEIHELEEACKKAESSSKNAVCPELQTQLIEELERSSAHTKNNARGYVDAVVPAEWQADAFMIGRAAKKDSVMMMTSDADMPILAGDDCLAMKGFTQDGKLEVVSTSEETIKQAIKYISASARQRTTYSPAKYPIFEGVDDRKLRALMCLILGCDVYGGMHGVTAKTLSDNVIKTKYPAYKSRRPGNNEVSLYSYLKKYLYSKTDGMDHDVVQTYIQSLIYEPTNIAPNEEEKCSGLFYRTYVNGKSPTVLPKYLEEFAAEGTEIKDGPTIATCIGVGASGHRFLAADGYNVCNNCQGTVCKHCHECIGTDILCLLCYAEKSIVPITGESVQASNRSIVEMREELSSKYNFDSVDELTVGEIEEFYEVKDVVNSRINEVAGCVQFPLYSSRDMDGEVYWQELMEIDLADGGSFLTNPDLDRKHLPAILEFFGSLVRFESKKRTDHVKDSPIYDSIPEILINFAENSRVDSGYRLLARAVRHGFDSRISAMSDCMVKLVVDGDGNAGIRIKSEIPASMKKKVYESEIAATSKNIMCCKCTCPCGSQGDERIVCVHTIVRLLVLSVFLHQHLAENMLCELTARIVDSIESDPSCADDTQWLWDMGSWTESELKSIKENVILLMEAAGEVVPHDSLEGKSIADILQSFLVGTQRRKDWIKGSKVPPKPSQLGPVAEMDFMSTAKRAKLTMRRDGKRKQTKNTSLTMEESLLEDAELLLSLREDNIEDDSISNPEYRKVWSLMNAAGIDLTESSSVGFKLLYLRADVQDKEVPLREKKIMDDKSKIEWSILKLQAKKRSLNSTKSQRNNLNKKRTQTDSSIPSTPNASKRRRIVTPSPANHCIADRTRLRRNKQNLPIAKKKKISKRPKYIKCHMPYCPVNNKNKEFIGICFHRVPTFPAELKSKTPKKTSVSNRQARIFHRREMLRRMLIDANSKSHYWVCERHQFEQKPYSIPIQHNGKSFSQTYNLTLPKDIGPKSNQHLPDESAGLGSDRILKRALLESKSIIQNGWINSNNNNESDQDTKKRSARPTSMTAKLREVEAERDKYKNEAKRFQADAVSATLALNQCFEQNCPNQHVRINPTVKKLACLDKSIPDPAMTTPHKGHKIFFKTERQFTKTKATPKLIAHDPPTVDLQITDDEVKRRTGFPSLHTLLAYILIACNGDVSLITKRSTSLTWLEEWFLHFEYKWGRTLSRLCDIEKTYGPKVKCIRQLIANKYNIEFRARSLWPVYASHEEDISIRKPKWNDKYPRNQRIVMWDMTNINAYGFSDPDLQRLTYSKYYNENCFKGGVFVQLCGWLGTGELWPGAVSDSDYNAREGYMKRQETFATNDLVELEKGSGVKEVLPFTNVYDKGYRAKAVAWKCGRQQVLQPDWAESDKHFSRSQTLRSASIATDRAGNERGVNVCKRSWFLVRGFTPHMSPILINNAWTTWSYQTNFMYGPVL